MEVLPLEVLNILSGIDPVKDSREDDETTLYNELKKLDFSSLCQPVELLHYTKTENGKVKMNSKEGLKNLKISLGQKKRNNRLSSYEKIIGSDLTSGFEKFKKKSFNEIYQLEDLLSATEYSIQNGLEDGLGSKKLKIISLRRVLTEIMKMPLNISKERCFVVIFWKNLIIIDYGSKKEEDGLLERMSSLKINDRQSLLQYTGFKFEEIVTEQPSSLKALEYYTLVRQNIDDFSVIFTAEIDASADPDGALSSYVELKTHNQVRRQTDAHFRRAIASSWCQTKLIAGRHIVYGFRTRGNKLGSIKKYAVSEIPGLVDNLPTGSGQTITCRSLLMWYVYVLRWLTLFRNKNHQSEKMVCSMHVDTESGNQFLKLKPHETEMEDIINSSLSSRFRNFMNEM